MTLADTCLRMVARATFCDRSLWDRCNVLLIAKVHLWWHLAFHASSVTDRKAYDLCHHVAYWKGPHLNMVWSLYLDLMECNYFCYLITVKRWKVLKYYASIIHSMQLTSHVAEMFTEDASSQLILMSWQCVTRLSGESWPFSNRSIYSSIGSNHIIVHPINSTEVNRRQKLLLLARDNKGWFLQHSRYVLIR
jgi:hypothetical protein